MKTLLALALPLALASIACDDDKRAMTNDNMMAPSASGAPGTTVPTSRGEGERERMGAGGMNTGAPMGTGANATGGAGSGVNVGNGSNTGGGTGTGGTTGNGTNVGTGSDGHGHPATMPTGADPLGTVGGEGHGHVGSPVAPGTHDSTGKVIKKTAAQIKADAEKAAADAKKQIDGSTR